VLTYQHHGRSRAVKALSWAAAVLLALLIIAARKHYTVDVVIAWYTVPLVYCCLNMYWSRQQQRQQQLLPEANSPAAAAAGSGWGSIFYSACPTTTGIELCSGCGQCDNSNCSSCCYSPTKKTLQPLADSYSPCRSPEQRIELGMLQDNTIVVDCHSGGRGTLGMHVYRQPSCATPRTPSAAAAAAQAGNAQEGSWPLLAVWGHRRVGSNGSTASGSSAVSGSSGSSGSS
jgi:hypothetical protein